MAYNLSNINIFLLLLSQFCLYIMVGIFSYMFLIKYIFIKWKLENLSFLAWVVIFASIIFILKLILALLSSYLPDFLYYFNNFEIKELNYMGDGGSNTGLSSGQSGSNTATPYSGRPADGAIMATGLAIGAKLAQSQPTLAGKAAVLTGGVFLGAGAIVGKNISGNLSSDLGKKSFMSTESLADLIGINLSGNNLLDLISVIQLYHSLSIIFSLLIAYYLILLNIDTLLIESKLKKYLNSKVATFVIRIINYTKKSG